MIILNHHTQSREFQLVKSTAVKAVSMDDDMVFVEYHNSEKVYGYECGRPFVSLLKETIASGKSIGKLIRELYNLDYWFYKDGITYTN